MTGTQAQNSIIVIRPYRLGAGWAFDDERVGLYREPFVAGVPEIIDRMIEDHDIDARNGVSLYFSENEFPGWQRTAWWTREEHGGNWYSVYLAGGRDGLTQEGWLCPALFKYFHEAPAKLYIKIEEEIL